MFKINKVIKRNVLLILIAGILFQYNMTIQAEGLNEIPPEYKPIYTAEDLYKIRYNLTGKYILMNDIDLSEYSQGEGWDPIKGVEMGSGPYTTRYIPFKGILDGNGHKIKNLKINRPNENGIGLFSTIEYPGEVKNLSLENVNIIGKDIVGALAGGSSGSIINVKTNGNVIGNKFVGGLVGRGLLIENCKTSGSVSGNEYVSRIVGESSLSAMGELQVKNCESDASVIGASGELIGGMITQNYQGWWFNVYNDEVIIYWYTGNEKDVKIPSTLPLDNGFEVVEIEATAFSGNQLIESVEIPSTVKKIGQGAFANCINLKNINILE